MVSWFIQESGDHSIFVSSSERSPIIYFANINQLRSQLFAVKQSIENSLQELDANLDAQKISFKAVAETLNNTTNNLSVIRDYINEAVQAAGQESQKLFNLIASNLVGIVQVRALAKRSNTLKSRYESVVNLLQRHRKASLDQDHQEVFGRSCDYTRFADLTEIAKKFSVRTDNASVGDFCETESATSDYSGELVLF